MDPKQRVRCAYIGVCKHECVLREWSSVSGAVDLAKLINSLGMNFWGRRMPRASELLRAQTLTNLYLVESSTLRFLKLKWSVGSGLSTAR